MWRLLWAPKKWSELWCTLIKYAKPRATLKLEFVFCSFEKLITTVSHIGIYHWKIITVRHCNLPVFELGHDLQNFYFFTFIISWYHTLMWVYKLFFVVFFGNTRYMYLQLLFSCETVKKGFIDWLYHLVLSDWSTRSNMYLFTYHHCEMFTEWIL